MAETSAPQGGSSLAGFLDHYFGLTENRTTIRTEFVAGLTTFLTMVYIVFVNPEILSGRFAEAKPAVVLLAVLFAVKFAIA